MAPPGSLLHYVALGARLHPLEWLLMYALLPILLGGLGAHALARYVAPPPLRC